PLTRGVVPVNALVASTHLLIPIQSSYFALEGTDDLLETIEKVRARANPTLKILAVVITMHDKRTALARDIRTQIDKVFGKKVFRTVITKSVRLEESPAYKESIFKFAPDSSGATEYYRLCEEVMDRVLARVADFVGDAPRRGLRRGAGQFCRNAHRTAGADRTHRPESRTASPGHGRPVRVDGLDQRERDHRTAGRATARQPVSNHRRRAPLSGRRPDRAARIAGGHSRGRRHRDHRSGPGRKHPTQGPGPIRRS